MGAYFFQNGAGIGSSAGWGGYTGSNNYVVRYDFATGAAGADSVTLALSGIYYGNNAGTQGFGFKLGTSAAAWANARNEPPDSSLGTMCYTQQAGYCCTMSATGLNLSPYTSYYLFVYAATGGAEYYTGWNCTAPQITLGGAYVPPASTISSLSEQVKTQGALALIMNRAGSCWHRARFFWQGEPLGTSEAFAATLSYPCPRAWMEKAPDAQQMRITVAVQSYEDAACTRAVGAPIESSFLLRADEGMHPVLGEEAVRAEVCNTGAAAAFDEYIAGVSRARVHFDTAKISLDACAGAQIVAYRVTCKGTESLRAEPVVDTGVLLSDCTLVCTVTDSRGREGSTSCPIHMLPYVPPSLSGLSAVRCTAEGATDAQGAYCKLKGTLHCTALNGANRAAVSVSIQPTGGQWSGETPLDGFESGKWSNEWAMPTVLGGALHGDSYTLRLQVSDAVGSRNFYTLRLYQQQWAMKFNADGTAVGFGMAPTAANAVQLPDSWRLYAGALVLSENAYGTRPPEEAVAEPVDGQLYFYLTD